MDAHKGRLHAGSDSIFDVASICRIRLGYCCTHFEDQWVMNRLLDFNLWNSIVGATAKKHLSLDVRLQNDDEGKSVVIRLLSRLTAWTEKYSELALEDIHRQSLPQLDHSAPNLGVSTQSQANEPGSEPASHTLNKEENEDEDEEDDEDDEDEDDSEITLTEAKSRIEGQLDMLFMIGLAIWRAGTGLSQSGADLTFKSDSNTQEYEDLKGHLESLLRLPLLLNAQKPSNLLSASSDAFSAASSPSGSDVPPPALSPEQEILVQAVLERRHRIRVAQRQGMKLKDLRPSSQEMSTMPSETLSPILGVSETSRDNPKHEYSAAAFGKYTHSTLPKPPHYTAGQTLEQKTQTQSEGVAATIVSMQAAYPPPPSIPDGVQDFQCPYCCLTFPIELLEGTRLWRKHVSEDIQPYTCFLPSCPMQNGEFNTLAQWKSHIKRGHRGTKYWKCLVCRGLDRFESEASLSEHIKNLHVEFVRAEDVSAVAQMSLAAEEPRIITCPICSINKTDWEKNEQDKCLPYTGTKFFIDHIGQCIHDFSLRSLPGEAFAKQVHDSPDTDRNAPSHTPSSSPASSEAPDDLVQQAGYNEPPLPSFGVKRKRP